MGIVQSNLESFANWNRDDASWGKMGTTSGSHPSLCLYLSNWQLILQSQSQFFLIGPSYLLKDVRHVRRSSFYCSNQTSPVFINSSFVWFSWRYCTSCPLSLWILLSCRTDFRTGVSLPTWHCAEPTRSLQSWCLPALPCRYGQD